MRFFSKLVGGMAFLCGSVLAAEWQVAYPNVMTIAIGVSAPDEKTVYVSGANDGTGSTILKSSDEGATWDVMPHDFQMMYLDVDVAKGTTFGVAGAIGIFGMNSGSSYTEDGEVFQATPDNNFVFATQSVSAVDAKTFYMVSSWQQTIRDSYHYGVVATFDGAQTLNYFDWNVDTYTRYGSFPSNSTWFVSGGTWPAKSGQGNGKTFQLSPRFELIDGSIRINMDDNAMGKADGYIGVIARTTNGGQSFEVVFNDTGRFYFNAIDCPTETACWAVAEGPEGAWIFHTNDGGRTWSEQLFQSSAGLFDVKMINAKEGWVVGGSITAVTFNALFLYTSDGGATWTNANTIENAYPNSITVVDSNRAYATAFLRNGLSSILVFK